MVKGSQSWISEAQSWLTTPCTYTTARCLDSHVSALQVLFSKTSLSFSLQLLITGNVLLEETCIVPLLGLNLHVFGYSLVY